ncbi:hypothetical protein F4810DRAFT_289123 [Camillea tinctor]|nr:hypothetical protein F4810DRAFT_289123 [Camillea tinctor]
MSYQFFNFRRNIGLTTLFLLVFFLVIHTAVENGFAGNIQAASYLPTSHDIQGADFSVDIITEETLRKRARTYEQAIEFGRRLNCIMSATRDHAQQLNGGTPLEVAWDFTEANLLDVSDANYQGWQALNDPAAPYYGTRLNQALQDIGADLANTQYMSVIHSAGGVYINPTDDNDEMNFEEPIQATFARWGNGINAEAGVIIADKNISPRNSDRYYPGMLLPAVKQWSEAAFGQWEQTCSDRGQDLSNVRYIIRSWITNAETQDHVFRALRNLGITEVPTFANRRTFDRESQEPDEERRANEINGFYAILGTPNGSGGAFLLATHKDKLGVKRFRSVTLWTSPVAWPIGSGTSLLKLVLMFEVESVPEPTS